MQNMALEVKRAQQGDREAFIRLLRKLESELYGLAKSIVRRDEDCADAIQETTLKAYKALSTLQKPQFFKTWLIRILINECNTLLRGRQRTVVMAELPETSAAADYYADSRKFDLREAVDQLEDTLRVAIHLFYFQDLSIKQIAAVLDITEGAVKARLHRARGILADRVTCAKEANIAYET